MKRLQRLHAISERLRTAAPDTVSTRTLANDFDVSRRTIERDLEALRLAGAPLWGQAGRSGGVSILDEGPRRVITLSDADIAALVVAAHAVGDAPFATNARRAAETLVAHSSPATQAAVDLVRSTVLLARTDRTQHRVRHVLEDAVVTRRQVSIVYRDRHEIETRRRIDPVGFLGNGSTWSVVAFCYLRQAGRLFRLARIERATATTEPTTARNLQEVLGDIPFEATEPR